MDLEQLKRIAEIGEMDAKKAAASSEMLAIMRPHIDKADGGYVCDMFPQFVVAAGKALLAAGAPDLRSAIPTWWERAGLPEGTIAENCSGIEEDWQAEIAELRAHIAQRAARGDADYYAHIARVAQDAAALLKKMTPAPIADEVAGDTVAWLVTLPGGELELGAAYFDKDEADDYVENHAKEGCYLTELVVRPAAPKASAPDAAAGDLPPLPPTPKPVHRHPQLGELFDRFSLHAYAMKYACAARAAAAPAGHAEPVGWTLLSIQDPELTNDPVLAGYWARKGRKVTPLYAAPVAAEPAPKAK